MRVLTSNGKEFKVQILTRQSETRYERWKQHTTNDCTWKTEERCINIKTLAQPVKQVSQSIVYIENNMKLICMLTVFVSLTESVTSSYKVAWPSKLFLSSNATLTPSCNALIREYHLITKTASSIDTFDLKNLEFNCIFQRVISLIRLCAFIAI